MSIHILLREQPQRSIALVTEHHALIFHHNPSILERKAYSLKPPIEKSDLEAPCCVVEFTSLSSINLDDYNLLHPLPVYGILGLISIRDNFFLSVVTGSTKAATVRPGETVEKILGVEFYCLNRHYENTLGESLDSFSIDSSYYSKFTSRDSLTEHPCAELQKLLSDGSFYYSTDFDLTNRLQDRNIEVESLDMDNMDRSFLWNSFMIEPLVNFRSRLLEFEKKELDHSQILTSAIRGFVCTSIIPSYAVPRQKGDRAASASLTLISRLSCKRAGTRFNSRGIDDDGNVANFVETETIYWSSLVATSNTPAKQSGVCFSYVQVRGSVPLFWEQAVGLLPGQQKISIVRSSEGTQLSFDKHFSELEKNYESVHIVNLLSVTKPCEAELTSLYRRAVHIARKKRLGKIYPENFQFLKETEYDLNAETKGTNDYEVAVTIRELIQGSANTFAYYLLEDQVDLNEGFQKNQGLRTTVIMQQQGVFRTNCLDCLDRTNLIQIIISKMAIEICFAHLQLLSASEFWTRHSTLWADNGDALSRIYAGTGALKTSFTRHGKMSLAGAISDARKSATRHYINNFADKGRQNTIDVLLGRLVEQKPVHLFDPINDYVMAELSKKVSEYQSFETIKIWCGTFNLNGRTLDSEESISSWLYPGLDPAQQTPEIVAVGFQEIVGLSPQQLMNTDPTRRELWEKIVLETLNKRARYVLLRSGQLVGASLMIFVKKTLLPYIRNVEGCVKKTGMSGMAGNKGAVAIRMDYANTPLCFVTAHLASGHANYEERNNEYSTIKHGLRFQHNRGIDNHEKVIWMGDFNYRIGLEIEKVKRLIENNDIDTLFHYDQLNSQMAAGVVFPNYSESQITFSPTYKFDLGTDNYDTSEKARIPAWTDRILFKGAGLCQISYDTVPLRFSDHRPVYATFLCTVSIINEARREALSRQLYEDRRACINNFNLASSKDQRMDKHNMKPRSIRPNISSHRSDDRLVYSNQTPPATSKLGRSDQMMSNLKLSSNLNSGSDESDWVAVPRMSLSKSLSSPSLPRCKSQTSISINSDFPGKPDNSLYASSNASTQMINHSQVFSQKKKLESNLKATFTTLPDECHMKNQNLFVDTNSNSKIRPPPVARKPVHLSTSAFPSHVSIVSPTTARNQVPPAYILNETNLKNLGPDEVDPKLIREPPKLPPPRRSGGNVNNILNEKSGDNFDGSKSNIMDGKQLTQCLLGNDCQTKIVDWEALEPT